MRTLILSLFVLLAVAAPASAGTITRSTSGVNTYVFTGNSTANDLSVEYVSGRYEFNDDVAIVNSAGTNCQFPTAGDTTLLSCDDNVSQLIINLGSGDDTLQVDHAINNDDGVPDPATINGEGGIDRLEGTDLDDTITGGDSDDDIFGFAGEDAINGGAGADELRGSNDPLVPSDSSDAPDLADTITDTSGNNVILAGGDGGDQITTGTGNDTVEGEAGNDTITDSGGTNNLRGGAGADTITGGPGNDTIAGASATTTGDTQDTITPGRGRDTVIGGPGADTVTYGEAGRTVGVTVTLGIIGSNGSAEDGIAGQRDSLAEVETIVGTAFDDSLTGDGGANTFNGGAGNDTLRGGDGADTLNGGDGAADVVTYSDRVAPVKVTLNNGVRDDGSIPNDVTGPTSFDAVDNVEIAIGGASNDTLTGSAGAETFDGGPGADTIDGGAGTDLVTYAGAPEKVDVSLNDGVANDGGVRDISGANQDNTIAVENVTGSAGNDVLIGDGGVNVLDGGAGNDTLTGGAGADSLFAGEGDDTIAARDAVAEDIDCGGGNDGGSADVEDRLAGCEAVDVPRPTPRLFIDTDNDGVPLGVDCDDNDARRFQGNPEIPGNTLDEDCLNGAAPFSVTTATFAVFYETRGKRLKLTGWTLSAIPAGAKLRITCKPPKGKSHRKDCPFKTYTKTFTKATSKVSFLKTPLKNKLLTGGTKIRMEVSQPLAIGRVRLLTMRSADIPKDTKSSLCRVPGAKKDTRCP